MPNKPLREVAKELARNAVERLNKSPASAADIDLVQARIVEGMRAALAEPSEEMITAAIRDKTPVNVDSFLNTRHKLCESVFKAMTAVRRRELS
jgi:hypothetical protein